MADKKIIPSWRQWLYTHAIANPMTFLFITHRKTTMCAIIVAMAIFSLAICFPPFIPALISFKLITFAPFAFMAAMGLTHAALTAAGLAAGATVLAIKALYLAEQAIRVALPRMYYYFYPASKPPHQAQPVIMETYTIKALFNKFSKAAQVDGVVKIKKNNETSHIDVTRLKLKSKTLASKENDETSHINDEKLEALASQDIVQVTQASTAIDWLNTINLKGYSIFKVPKPGSLRVGHELSTDRLGVNAP